jgi:chitin disaccharide deacetylase
MPTGLAFGEAVSLALATPTLDVGVHLTLVGERPVSPPRSIPSLVGPDGHLHSSAAAFTRQYLLGRIRPAEVTRELEAQVARVFGAGIRPTHLDSHQHVHVLPGVLDSVLHVSRHFDVPWVRLPAERAPWRALGRGAFKRVAEALVLSTFCHPARRRLHARTDGMIGFMESPAADSRASDRGAVGALLPPGVGRCAKPVCVVALPMGNGARRAHRP